MESRQHCVTNLNLRNWKFLNLTLKLSPQLSLISDFVITRFLILLYSFVRVLTLRNSLVFLNSCFKNRHFSRDLKTAILT